MLDFPFIKIKFFSYKICLPLEYIYLVTFAVCTLCKNWGLYISFIDKKD